MTLTQKMTEAARGDLCVGETMVFTEMAEDIDMITGLKARRRFVVVFEDIEYVNKRGDVVTTMKTEMFGG